MILDDSKLPQNQIVDGECRKSVGNSAINYLKKKASRISEPTILFLNHQPQ